LPTNELAVEAISFIERLAENPPFIVRLVPLLRLVLLLRPPVNCDEMDSKVDVAGDDVVGDGVVGDVVVGVADFFVNMPVMDSQKPPFIVLFFLYRIYIIIQEIIK
jgi:hypothetical protein